MLASRIGGGVRPAPIQSARVVRMAPVVQPAVVCRAAAVDAPAVEAALAKEGAAHLNFQRGSVFKVRRVLDVIRGRSYEEAMMLMEYLPYKSCESIVKALKSAAANAKENAGASKARLVVGEAFADQGPHMRRFRCRAQGRGFKILKPTFHLTIRLQEKGEDA